MEWKHSSRQWVAFAALHILIKLLGATLRFPGVPRPPPLCAKSQTRTWATCSTHTPLILLILLLRPKITGPQKPRGSPDQDPDQDQDHKAADAPTFKPTEVKRQNKMAAHAQAGASFSSSCPCATISGISGISGAFFLWLGASSICLRFIFKCNGYE